MEDAVLIPISMSLPFVDSLVIMLLEEDRSTLRTGVTQLPNHATEFISMLLQATSHPNRVLTFDQRSAHYTHSPHLINL